ESCQGCSPEGPGYRGGRRALAPRPFEGDRRPLAADPHPARIWSTNLTVHTGYAGSAQAVRSKPPGLFQQMWASRSDYLYVLPAIVVMLVVIAYPIYYTVDLSFFRTPPGLQLRDKVFIGVDNYTTILSSDVFWRVTLNTAIWTLASTVIAIILGFASALALHRDFGGRAILRAIRIIPWVISAVA